MLLVSWVHAMTIIECKFQLDEIMLRGVQPHWKHTALLFIYPCIQSLGGQEKGYMYKVIGKKWQDACIPQ